MPLAADVIAALIDRHAAPLALWIAGRCNDADDVVQEAFCRLAASDSLPEQPAAWLYRVARNLAINQRLSHQRRIRRHEAKAKPESYSVDPAKGLIAADALAALSQLDNDLREVIVARIWGQLTFDGIAQLLEISTATASRRYQRALEQIRRKLNDVKPSLSK